MEHLLLKAATTATTDQGEFEAVISTASIDRDGDIVEPRAIVTALAKWVPLGKMVPLAYSHRDPATGQAVVIGHIDPASARVNGKEVIAKGWVDQSTERGAETWRLVKSGTLSFSYGYLVPDGGATKRVGKKTGYHITEIDLYEISVVPVGPANNDTRVLSFKSAEELRVESGRLAREVEETKLEDVPPKQETPPGPLTKALDGLDTNTLTAEQVAERLDALAFGDVHLHVRVVTPDELAGITSGEVKAVWTTAYVTNLPDSAFLHIEAGGSKDSEGKTTPRSLRHFAHKDADGNVDAPHLRNALSRIPQSNLSQDVKDLLTSRARKILDDQQQAVDVTDKETKSRSVDPLRKRSEELALEIASDGMSLRRPPAKHAEQVREGPSPEELKRMSRELMEEVLSYGME